MLSLAYERYEREARGDRCLRRIAKDLQAVLAEAQETFEYDSLHLEGAALKELAEVLVDFAFDIHCDVGIWEAYEDYNLEWFGTPLPMSVTPGSGDRPAGIHPARIRHLLWVVYPELIEDLILSPSHQDVLRIAEAAHPFLDERLSSVPKDSAARNFLATPNRYGWDVKRKLGWLGT